MKTLKQFRPKSLLLVLMLSLLFLNVQAVEKQVVDKTFKAKPNVEIKTVSGDVVIKKGKSDKIKVHVEYTFPRDRFEPIFEEQGDALVLKEKFHKKKEGYNYGKREYSKWEITLPEKTDIRFATASGDFHMTDIKGSSSFKSASGDVTLVGFKGTLKGSSASGDFSFSNCSGEFTLKTASGDIKVQQFKGSIHSSSASGDIDGSSIDFTGECAFTTSSGDVKIELSKTPNVNLSFKNVSGDIKLDYNGNALKGYFTFNGKVDNFYAPVPFDNGGKKSKYSPFGTRTIDKGSSPNISFKTVSGEVRLRK
jgi:DUF4097 and DUF4098 domain-containing protein YvlB